MSAYFKMKIGDKERIVKANSATTVKNTIFVALRDQYEYKRATTEDVVNYMGSGGVIEDLDDPDSFK